MKKIIYLGLLFAGLTSSAQVKIGDNPTNLGASSSLELESTNKALVLTRVANTAAITTPVNGMIVYDLSSNCVKAYENGVWSNCLSAGATPGTSLTVDCNTSGIVGDFTNGVALSGASFSVKIINNSSANSTLSFAAGDLALSGASAGITVGTPTPASATLNPGQQVTVVYPLSGTPNTGTETTLTATWTKLTSLTCTKTTSVLSLLARLNDGGFSSSTALTGSYTAGVPLNSGNTFIFTMTNNSGSAINGISPPQGSNFVISGTGAGSISVLSIAPTGTFNLATGATRTFTYTLSGTPSVAGTNNFTATLNYNGYTSVKTISIGTLQSLLVDNDYANTATLKGVYVQDAQIFGTNHKFEVTITNTRNAAVSNITAPTAANLTLTGAGQGLTVASVSPNTTFSLAPGASTTIVYTLAGTPTSGTITANWSFNGFTASATKATITGIKDRNYGLTINGQNNHNFIYQEVTATNGTVWLNNNLGADYADIKSTQFNPSQQATSATDFRAYGSLFQWGRRADGHELITYTNATTGTAVNGTTSTNSDAPADALFILEPNSPNDWRSTQDDTLWATEASANNPCPVGFRVPTLTELNTLLTAESITNSTTAASSTLKFTVPGYRHYSNGTLSSVGSLGYCWSSTVSGTVASSRRFVSGGTNTNNNDRALGFTVRCLKD